MAASSSSRRGLSSCKYDVFVSFRGEDTRRGFVSHLYDALRRKSINAYKDDVSLQRGWEISPALVKAIEDSKISVVVFSEKYATSRWCLDELVHILRCKSENGQIVLPVFYGVDPSHVRNQKESYASAFVAHVGPENEWRSALQEAGNLSGWDSSNYGSDSELLDKICEDILSKLGSISSAEGYEFQSTLVGMEKRLNKFEQLLCVDSLDVRIIGIWGMGGIGKSTLADAVHKRYYSRFDSCFFADISDDEKRCGLRELQKKLYSTLLKDEKIDMHNRLIDDRLSRTKVLVILDNVNDLNQLSTLIGDSRQRKAQLGGGSRIILTSRNKKLLKDWADDVYEVDKLDSGEALKLFRQNAFVRDSCNIEYIGLLLKIVEYAGGNPLALTVLGSYLRSRSVEEWTSALSELKEAPNKEIMNNLRLSYDAVDRLKQSILLDIACFLRGMDREFVEEILGDYSHIGISVLIEMSLITIVDGKRLSMHDLIQEMAWEIICQESVEREQRSRLWTAEDVSHVLKTNKGSAKIKGIYLDVSELSTDLLLESTVFEKMCNLRFLEICSFPGESGCKLIFDQGLEFLPDSLRYLCWREYPLKSLPSNFEPQSLVSLEMSFSKLEKLWDEVKHLDNLKLINLFGSEKLIELPDLSQAPKLERINVAYCISFRRFRKMPMNLKWLDMRSTAIKDFVESSLESLPNSGLRHSIQQFNAQSCKLLKEINIRGWMSLKELVACGCESLEIIDVLECTSLSSFKIRDCKSLRKINVSGCTSLKIIDARGLTLLKSIDASGCTLLEDIIASELTSLENFDAKGCTSLKELDVCELTLLESIDASGCTSLEMIITSRDSLYIPENAGNKSLNYFEESKCISLKEIYANGCTSLKIIKASVCTSLKIIEASGCTSLKRIVAEGCTSLKRIAADGCTSLEIVNIVECMSLEAFCVSDRTVLKIIEQTLLKNISGSGCPSLKSTDPSGCTSLRMFDASGCTSLEMIYASGCTSLRMFDASGCTSLELIYASGCTSLALIYASGCTSLTSISVNGCTSLETIDTRGCTSLETIDTSGCTSLKKFIHTDEQRS